ncbi:WD40/YVTN/BNR-like repeat-containing protein [Melittangium boletus]|uniref:WD40/YVTN/BNR-like repeat-containing protein n=1 Tax=Melittangium boletus TaxID=83453 RepID=UPI003DA3D49A
MLPRVRAPAALLLSCLLLSTLLLSSGAFAQQTPGLEVVHTNTTHRFLAVAPSGTAYALKLDDSSRNLYASTDGARTWSYKGRTPLGGSFHVVTVLADGTLLADTERSGAHYLARSSDGGATWTEVLSLGNYRLLTSRNIAELDGTVYLLEYQAFTAQNAPIRLYASGNRGRTWRVKQTFEGHRHGHGLAADPAHHALWAFFGDNIQQSAILRSTQAGSAWKRVISGQNGLVVTSAVLPDGSLLYAQDINWLPGRPYIVQLAPDGTYVQLEALSGAAYSTYAVRAGGFVAGIAREPLGDAYDPAETQAHVWASPDGVAWRDVLQYPRLDPNENVRADVYDELPSGLLVLQLQNVQGFGPGGRGYQLVRFVRP